MFFNLVVIKFRIYLNNKALLAAGLYTENELPNVIKFNESGFAPLDIKDNLKGGKSKKRRYSKKSKHLRKMKTIKHRQSKRRCRHGCKH